MAQYSNLIGHNLEKFGMITVLDATFYDVATGVPLIHFDTLKMSNISSEGQQKEIRGGQGAELLLTYDFGRTANVEVTDALASMYSLEYLWGGKVTDESFQYLKRVELTATGTLANWAALVALLNPTFVAGTGITVHNLSKDLAYRTTNGLDGGAVTTGGFTAIANSIVAGNKIVVYYTAATTANQDHTHQLTLTSIDFPPIVKMVGESFLLDQDTGKKIGMQIEIPRFKLDTNFSFTLEAEGDASVFDFSGVALSDNGNIIIMRTLGVID
jgi:hypothetical protein